MVLTVEVDPQAIEEAAAARDWYAARSPAAAEAFASEIAQGFTVIGEQPQMYPTYLRDTRRYLLKKFPYLIVFRQHNDRIQVLAIAHGSRGPRFWRERLAPSSGSH